MLHMSQTATSLKLFTKIINGGEQPGLAVSRAEVSVQKERSFRTEQRIDLLKMAHSAFLRHAVKAADIQDQGKGAVYILQVCDILLQEPDGKGRCGCSSFGLYNGQL